MFAQQFLLKMMSLPDDDAIWFLGFAWLLLVKSV